MPAILSIAGTAGGRQGNAYSASRHDFARKLLTGSICPNALADCLLTPELPDGVSLVLNNTCNLACSHCYLQVERPHAQPLTVTEWCRVLDSLMPLDLKLVSLSGKETLATRESREVMRYFGSIRERQQASFKVSLITNGTLLARHRDVVEDLNPDYMEISIDGDEEAHDAIRGTGAYQAAMPGLDWAVATYGIGVFTGLTIQRRNMHRLPHALSALHARNVQTVGCSFYSPQPYTDQSLTLSEADCDTIFDDLHFLESLELNGPLTVHFDVSTIVPEALLAFMRSEWYDFEALEVDHNGSLYNEHRLRNGLVLQFRFTPWPQTAQMATRLTFDGQYLLGPDTLNTRLYPLLSLGSIREHQLEFKKLHQSAKAAPRARAIVSDYCRQLMPKMAACHAEHPMTRRMTGLGRRAFGAMA